MTTHRLIQIHMLADTMSSKSRSFRRAADNLARTGNINGATHYFRAAIRCERVLDACTKRIQSL